MPEPTMLARLAVRDYPKNSQPIMQQRWDQLLFLHWEYDPQLIQKILPPGLHVDLYEGKAYVGLTPFFLKGLKPKLLIPLPGIPDFMEMNLRTYVYDDKGTPGVWFFSLDANNWLAVQTARNFFHLPYFYATMESYTNDGEIAYRCERQEMEYSVEFLYKGTGNSFSAEPGSLEFFLVERYVLFAYTGNELAMARIHHAPYPLQQGQAMKWDDKVFEWDKLERPTRQPDHLLFSPGVDVDIFNLQMIS